MPFQIKKLGVYSQTIKVVLRFYFRLIIGKDFEKTILRFRRSDGEKLRYEYKFESHEVVFDVGGFEGEFAEKFYAMNPCKIFVFEPVKRHFKILEEKFSDSSDIKIFNFGLDSKTQDIEISLSSNSSSYIRNFEKNDLEIIHLKDVAGFLEDEGIEEIALMKINIEGAEYDLLERLISNENMKNIRYLQIQFHDFATNAYSRRENLVKQILQTHQSTASFPMVWEFFERRD
jgi:FkbM family methyltransferase